MRPGVKIGVLLDTPTAFALARGARLGRNIQLVHVRFGSLADMPTSPLHVRFTPITDVGWRALIKSAVHNSPLPFRRHLTTGILLSPLASVCREFRRTMGDKCRDKNF